MKKLHALVLGATGATGKELVKLLLEDSNFSQVSLFIRRTIDVDHEKLTIHKIDFTRLNEYNSLVEGDVLFSALGTTK
jgi:aspartate-semialdehyde dehydrogenase